MNDYIETPEGTRVRLTLPPHLATARPATIARGDSWFLPLGGARIDGWYRPEVDVAA